MIDARASMPARIDRVDHADVAPGLRQVVAAPPALLIVAAGEHDVANRTRAQAANRRRAPARSSPPAACRRRSGPSGPICTVVLPAGATSTKTLPCTGSDSRPPCAPSSIGAGRQRQRRPPPDATTDGSIVITWPSAVAQPCQVVRIHRLARRRARPRRAGRASPANSRQVPVRAGQVVRHLVARALDLDRRDARERTELKPGIGHPVRRPHERLGQIDRILHDGRRGSGSRRAG